MLPIHVPESPPVVGPGRWELTRSRELVGRGKCENVPDRKPKHPAQILEASVVHDRSGGGGRVFFLSYTSLSSGGWDCQPFSWDPHVDVPFLSQALSPLFPPIVGTGKPAQFPPNFLAVEDPPPLAKPHCLGGGWSRVCFS